MHQSLQWWDVRHFTIRSVFSRNYQTMKFSFGVSTQLPMTVHEAGTLGAVPRAGLGCDTGAPVNLYNKYGVCNIFFFCSILFFSQAAHLPVRLLLGTKRWRQIVLSAAAKRSLWPHTSSNLAALFQHRNVLYASAQPGLEETTCIRNGCAGWLVFLTD